MNLPTAFENRIRFQLGADAEAFLAALDAPYQRGLRFRRAMARKDWPDGILEPIPWARDGWYLAADAAAGQSPAHEAGAFYLQEPSAMIPAEVLAPAADDLVLDLCAAPGGKSTQLAAMLTEGTLVANEIVPSRARILSSNIERLGFDNVVVTSEAPDRLAVLWSGRFDCILVDAPCSGEGMFRRHPETAGEWNEDAPAGCARRQLEILKQAAVMLRPGGRMVYSTCTFSRAENEEVMESFLAEHPDFRLVPFALPGLPEAADGMLRVWPHKVRGEGHFAALLRKAGEGHGRISEGSAGLPRPDAKQAQAFMAALGDIVTTPVMPDAMLGDRLVWLPKQCPPLAGVRVLRAGLTLGGWKGKTLVPDHALSHARTARELTLSSETDARRYLHGETLESADLPDGWCAVSWQGLPLGWGKAVQGTVKNHYPKGLRK